MAQADSSVLINATNTPQSLTPTQPHLKPFSHARHFMPPCFSHSAYLSGSNVAACPAAHAGGRRLRRPWVAEFRRLRQIASFCHSDSSIRLDLARSWLRYPTGCRSCQRHSTHSTGCRSCHPPHCRSSFGVCTSDTDFIRRHGNRSHQRLDFATAQRDEELVCGPTGAGSNRPIIERDLVQSQTLPDSLQLACRSACCNKIAAGHTVPGFSTCGAVCFMAPEQQFAGCERCQAARWCDFIDDRQQGSRR